MKYDSNDLYYDCFLSAISGSSLMNHDVAACRIMDFLFPPSNFESFIFQDGPKQRLSYSIWIWYSFSNAQVPRLTHVLEPRQQRS